MKLLTNEIEAKFKKIGRQEDVKDPIVVCKFFNPAGSGTWWATEMSYRIKIRRRKDGDEDSRVHRVWGEGIENGSVEMQDVCESTDCKDEEKQGYARAEESNVQKRDEDRQRVCHPVPTGASKSRPTRICDEECSYDGEEIGTTIKGQRDSASQERNKERRQDRKLGVDDENRASLVSHAEDELEVLEVEASEIEKYEEYEVLDKIFFGYVSIHGDHCDEWGSFALRELEEYRGRFGLGIERDKFFDPQPMSEACPKALL